jgi:hypothetical protein
MNLKKLLYASSTLICVLLSSCKGTNDSSLSGAETVGGNSGDVNAREKQVMPFSKGQKEVKYCLEIGSDLSDVERGDLLGAVADAFKSWLDYIVDADINARLIAGGGFALPNQFILEDGCSNATVKFYFGTEVSDPSLKGQLRTRNRDSTIAAIFDWKSLVSAEASVVWINGVSRPLLPDALSKAEVPKIDFTDPHELKAVTRYIVGRLFGNGLTPSGILSKKPEELLNCYRAKDPACMATVHESKIDSSISQLVTSDSNGKSVFKGCINGQNSGGRWSRHPARLVVASDGRITAELNSDANVTLPSLTWTAAPERIEGQKIEVFAQNSPARLFYEEFEWKGYLSNASNKPQNASLKVNQNGSAIDLIRSSPGAISILFSTRPDVCGR